MCLRVTKLKLEGERKSVPYCPKMGTTWEFNLQQSEFLKFRKLNKGRPYVPSWMRAASQWAVKQRLSDHDSVTVT